MVTARSPTIKKALKVHPDNRLNALPGNRWLFFTRSILKTDYDKNIGFELREAHGSSKPPQLMKEFIEFFTRRNEIVFDPFSGVGGTLLGASMSNRRAIGVELNRHWVEVYKRVCKVERLREQEVFVGDCLEILEDYRQKWAARFHLVLTDPPYGPYLDKSMCNGKYLNRNRVARLQKSSVSRKDLGNSKNLDQYLRKMHRFFEAVYPVLMDKRYLILITRDCYGNGRYTMTSARLADIAEGEGFVLKGEIIWHQNGTRLRPYGYPFVFVPNIIHHNILIFRKEEAE